MRRTMMIGALSAASLLPLSGCQSPTTKVTVLAPKAVEKDYNRELGPGEHALRKITDPREIPDFTAAFSDLAGLEAQVRRSLNYMGKPSSKQFFPVSGLDHDRVKASLEATLELIQRGGGGASLNAEFRSRFDTYTTVGFDNRGSVLLTGYYTPIFGASLTQTSQHRYPLYRLPTNHVKNEATGETLGLRRADGSIDKNYPARRELEASGMLKGLELVWFADPVEAYVVSVQGSAILKLTDGTSLEIGYAGTNGREYRSIGAELVKRGKLQKSELNLKRIMKFFRDNPGEFESVTAVNERYIFFQQVQGGPFGSLNEQVAATRSIATDKSIFPRASLCLVEATLPSQAGGQQKVSRWVMDQDTGGAIRAPGRLDYYWGIGPEAEATAGHTLTEGRLYYLMLNDAEYRTWRSRSQQPPVTVKK